MPPREQRDMSAYATKSMIGWAIVILSMVVSGGFTLTASHVSGIVKEHTKHPHEGAVQESVFSTIINHLNKEDDKLEKKQNEIVKEQKDQKEMLLEMRGDLKFLVNSVKEK